MLILGRRAGEAIVIGGRAVVTVRTLRTYGCIVDVEGIGEPYRKTMNYDESFEIPELEAEVVLLSGQGNQVHIGVNAPKDVSVNRDEIQRRIDAGTVKP